MQADELSTIEDDTRGLDEGSQASLSQARSSEGVVLAEELVGRCKQLLGDLEAFQDYLAQHNRGHIVEVKPFRNSVAAELKSLEKLRSADPEADRTVHTLRSSNLPFYNAVWDAAKTSSGLMAFTKRFYWDTPPTRSSKRSRTPKKKCALVDIVAHDGQQWIKVSTVTETRLLFELAKAGWEGADSTSDSEDGDGRLVNGLADYTLQDDASTDDRDSSRKNKENEPVEIVRQALDLRKASLAHKTHYKHPSVTFILPKISQHPPPEVVSILDSIRSTGAAIHLGPPEPPTNLQSAFENLVLDPFTNLTPTLNIDCTILLALVSDLSHCAATSEPWYHKAINRQIEVETREQLLPSILWPAMADRNLTCTQEAARRMREIVDTIGTESERKRSDLLILPFVDDTSHDQQSKSPEALRTAFAALSNHDVPPTWQLPIKTVASEMHDFSLLPPVARKVQESLSAINQSVFLHGWVKRWTTLTSNRTVAKQIAEIVEGGEGEQVGPSVWLCGTARSLVGKEKGRRDLKRGD
ncbi:MAG: hypothetical protein Q9200_000666 [Gallowayella weberi]